VSELVALAAIAVILTLLVNEACRRRDATLRTLLLVQVGYWSIAYLGRAGLLVGLRPEPQQNDSLADPRLYIDGYTKHLADILWMISAGLGVYLACIWAYRRRPGSRLSGEKTGARCSVLLGMVTYIGGWCCRLLIQVGADNAVVSSIALFGSLGVGLLLMKANWLMSRKAYAMCAFALLCVEGLYGTLIESKTPILTVFLFTLLGIAKRGWRLKPIVALGGVFLFMLAFSSFQAIKTESAVADALRETDRTYPMWVRPVLPLLRRFDLLSAATDAKFSPAGAWLDSEFFLRIVHGLVPFLAPESWMPSGSAGLAWTSEVRRFSLPNAGLEVSLAEGFIAEGFAWLGWSGLCIVAGLAALVTVWLSRLLRTANPFGYAVAIMMLGQPTIFERGAQGMAEVTGQACQAALAFIVVWWLLDGARVNQGPTRPAMKPRLQSHSAEPRDQQDPWASTLHGDPSRRFIVTGGVWWLGNALGVKGGRTRVIERSATGPEEVMVVASRRRSRRRRRRTPSCCVSGALVRIADAIIHLVERSRLRVGCDHGIELLAGSSELVHGIVDGRRDGSARNPSPIYCGVAC
jgi:hypothetical protein